MNVKGLLIAQGTFCVAAAGGLFSWNYDKTKSLPDHQKGNSLLRIKEVFQASERVNFIKDPYTAKHHQNLVASLSSRQFAIASNKSKEELEELRENYFAGYIPNALRRAESSLPPVFRSVMLPFWINPRPQGFIFAGSVPSVHDEEAREAIIKGEYIRCPSLLPLKEVTRDAPEMVDVLITGTTNPCACKTLKKAYLRDVAHIAESRESYHEAIRPSDK